MKTKGFLLLLVGLFVSSCSTPIREVEEFERTEVVPFAPGEAIRPVQFRKIVVKLPRGQRIGSIQAGLLCVDQGSLAWQGGRLTLTDEELTEAFRDELEKANCPVVGDPDALFDDPSVWKADYLIAGLITAMKANVCYPNTGFGDFNTAKGQAYIEVEWQVYSRLRREVVYRMTTEGASTLESGMAGGDVQVFIDAFAVATESLLADEDFRSLLVRPVREDAEIPSEEIVIQTSEPFSSILSKHISQNRMGVVTVLAGGGHGSGFFIDEGGYLLTNEHVVREARFVTVKLITGRELIGEVLRKDPVCDVALIKVEESGMVPLPIRTDSPNIGDEVYVLGSPLQEELSATLSKGVLSGFRLQDERRIMQSDVNVLPGCSGGPLLDANGNVIGMTASGLFVAGVAPTGINFFVPIAEALSALNIQFDAAK